MPQILEPAYMQIVTNNFIQSISANGLVPRFDQTGPNIIATDTQVAMSTSDSNAKCNFTLELESIVNGIRHKILKVHRKVPKDTTSLSISFYENGNQPLGLIQDSSSAYSYNYAFDSLFVVGALIEVSIGISGSSPVSSVMQYAASYSDPEYNGFINNPANTYSQVSFSGKGNADGTVSFLMVGR